MLKRILRHFFPEQTLVVVLDKSLGRLPELNSDLKESLKTLSFHPGFQYLLQRLHAEAALLESYLKQGFKLSETELHHLQAGIYYLNWLDREVKKLTSIPSAPYAATSPSEEEAFSKIRQSLEPIGQ